MTQNSLLIILGNQLFPIEEIEKVGSKKIFMKEDFGLCTDHLHHKLKILFFFTAMREYRDYLQRHGFDLIYYQMEGEYFDTPYLDTLNQAVIKNDVQVINYFEIEDNTFKDHFNKYILNTKKLFVEHKSPMFLNEKNKFDIYANNKTIRMSSFYSLSRKKFKILLDKSNKPLGGKWSFDSENRNKLPKNIAIPPLKKFNKSKYHDVLSTQIKKQFNDHPGKIDNFWLPYCRKDALLLLDDFLKFRLSNFGTYEDAIKSNNNFLFHSFLSPILNVGLITPSEIISKTLTHSKKFSIPLNSVEGFIRQIIGWREFIRGIYYLKGREQQTSNFFNHNRKLSDHWYNATTGIEPLDDSIINCLNYGYTHHIPRLMIIANIMTLSRIHPKEIYKWFMEMFVDSSEWVMGPNVFGMGTFADGGFFATKPYSCSSNYILKMSDYKKGDWCGIVDGLYWKFIYDNKSFFETNPRLSIIPRSFDKINADRKKILFQRAEAFIFSKTV